MLRKQILSIMSVLTIATMILAACAGDTTPTETPGATQPTQAAPGATSATEPGATSATTPDTGGETGVTTPTEPYRVGIFSDVTTTNYWSYLGPNSSVWNSYVLQPQRIGLYGLSDKNFDLIPQIAQDMPQRPLQQEGNFYVTEIKLRDDVQWSDGTPVTAKDYAFTADTVLELQLPGNWSTTFDSRYLDRVEAVDDTTVKFYYRSDPGMAVHEWGALQSPIMSQAYWQPVVDEAKTAVGALTAPAADAPQEEQDAYQQRLTEALNLLYNHTPQGEPVAGAFSMGNWEQGAFVENQTNDNFYQTGAQVQVFANGAYQEVKSGAGGYEVKLGDPVSERIANYTVGPHVTSVVYTIYGSQDAAILALKNGDIDYILNSLGLQRGLRSQVEGQPGISVIDNPVNGYRYMGFNMRREPMNNVAFRQAVATLIDKQFVTQQILQGAAFPVDTFIAEGNVRWYSPDVPRWGVRDDGTTMTREERVNRAVELLQAAGFSWQGGGVPTYNADTQQVTISGNLLLPNGQPVPELELLAPVPGYDPLRSTFAVWIEQWLREVGIPVRANLKAFNVLREQVVNQQDFDMYILGWSLGIFPNDLEAFFHSSHAGPGDFNSGGYSNPQFDAQAEQINTCTTYEQCKQIAAELQTILGTELPYVILFETGIIEAYRSDVLEYPYTDTLSGLQYLSGLPASVRLVE